MTFKYIKVSTPKAKTTPGMSMKPSGKKPALGEGKRFKALTGALEAKGARNPEALAAWIGRKKLGVTKMAKISAKGRKTK